MNQVPHSDSPRSEFGSYLRSQRQQRDLSLADIARITKIPRRSLACLEEGAFESLPAEVFVRGFLRSYARCVGMDPEDTVARYREAGKPDEPESDGLEGEADGDVAPADVAGAGESSPRGSDDGQSDGEGQEIVEPVAEGESGLDNGRSWSHATGAFIARSLFDRDVDEEASRRGTVTLAVIILVILATLTTSYWLRRPSSSGSGVTDAGELAAPRPPARA